MEDTHSQPNGRVRPSTSAPRKSKSGGDGSRGKRNGRGKAPPLDEQLRSLLEALSAVRQGDFSARLSFDFAPRDAANARRRRRRAGHRSVDGGDRARVQRGGGAQRGVRQPDGPRRAGRRPRRADDRAGVAARAERRLGGQHRVDQRAHRRSGAADDGGRACHQRGRRRRLHAEDGAGDRGAAGQRASSCASGPPSTGWSISCRRSPRRSRASPRRSAPTGSWAVRPRCPRRPASGAISPTT